MWAGNHSSKEILYNPLKPIAALKTAPSTYLEARADEVARKVEGQLCQESPAHTCMLHHFIATEIYTSVWYYPAEQQACYRKHRDAQSLWLDQRRAIGLLLLLLCW